MFPRLRRFLGLDPRNGAHVGHVEEVQFLCEQDGPVEKLLKDGWTPVLRRHGVRRAYLVKAQLAGVDGPSIALAITKGSSPDPDVVNALIPSFRAVMAGSQFVDMLFLDSESEPKCSLVCRPFLHDV